MKVLLEPIMASANECIEAFMGEAEVVTAPYVEEAEAEAE